MQVDKFLLRGPSSARPLTSMKTPSKPRSFILSAYATIASTNPRSLKSAYQRKRLELVPSPTGVPDGPQSRHGARLSAVVPFQLPVVGNQLNWRYL